MDTAFRWKRLLESFPTQLCHHDHPTRHVVTVDPTIVYSSRAQTEIVRTLRVSHEARIAHEAGQHVNVICNEGFCYYRALGVRHVLGSFTAIFLISCEAMEMRCRERLAALAGRSAEPSARVKMHSGMRCADRMCPHSIVAASLCQGA
eukprot:1412034-Amphidinium_carterae.2